MLGLVSATVLALWTLGVGAAPVAAATTPKCAPGYTAYSANMGFYERGSGDIVYHIALCMKPITGGVSVTVTAFRATWSADWSNTLSATQPIAGSYSYSSPYVAFRANGAFYRTNITTVYYRPIAIFDASTHVWHYDYEFNNPLYAWVGAYS
jgi:hypothetical protein